MEHPDGANDPDTHEYPRVDASDCGRCIRDLRATKGDRSVQSVLSVLGYFVIVLSTHSSATGKANIIINPPTAGPITSFVAVIGSGRLHPLRLICTQGNISQHLESKLRHAHPLDAFVHAPRSFEAGKPEDDLRIEQTEDPHLH